jgi:hypothetical protein
MGCLGQRPIIDQTKLLALAVVRQEHGTGISPVAWDRVGSG